MEDVERPLIPYHGERAGASLLDAEGGYFPSGRR